MSDSVEVLLDELSDFVGELLVQYDYPGFESRGFRIGLPDRFNQGGSRLFAAALQHPSVIVRIVGLRWLQDHPGNIKPHVKEITRLLDDQDEWVRFESLGALERFAQPASGNALSCAARLKDESVMVRRGAGKALSKVLPRVNDKLAKELNEVREKNLSETRSLMHQALEDKDVQVRQKVEKALRRSGELV